MRMRTIGFALTNRCNAACRVCCFHCGPRRSLVMDEGVVRHCIDEAAAMGTVEQVRFSGGEALLHPEMLARLCRYAKERHGIPSAVISNGFWARDVRAGRVLMEELKACGLEKVRISADLYHQEYVPAEVVRSALRIASDLDMLESVTIMDVKGHHNIRASLETLRPGIYLAPYIVWYPLCLTSELACDPKVGLDRRDVEEAVPWDACYCDDFSGPRVFWDGRIYNCCSPFSFEIPRMCVGKASETTVEQAWRQMNRDPILDMIRRDSVSWLARKARELGVEVRDRYSSGCELCRDLLCDEELVAKLEPIARAESQRRRLQKLRDVTTGTDNGRTTGT